ncbi:hypothetical protein SDC9_41563 [bioreactor metagenome]|jgi:hypothetical protein|uniref:Uncharacterized protein n=1 Tax=bioreactor metagenome TaxID=1076179 RepID=A0A644VYL5_9ZZZZ|nr:DUF2027 domain-containing protein [Lentimicrobium sp.]MEA5112147.1 DUF2027 domain-containing protein [Lentimicrobium sp.]
MELRTGDKVRFLNEKGEGIVTRILSNTMVNVAIEEGFEVPVLASDLIRIEPQGMAGRFFDRNVNVELPAGSVIAEERNEKPVKAENASGEDEPDGISPLYRQSGAGVTEGIYLIYAPHDQKWLMTGNLDIYLVNNSRYEAIFSFMLKEEEGVFSGVNFEVIPPYSKMLIETITREDLDSWSEGIVQVIFHSAESMPVLSPLHAAFKIKSVRFYKETSYQEFRLAGLKSVVLNLGDISGQLLISGAEPLMTAVSDPAARQKISAIAPPAYIDRFRTAPREAEVDLHISSLRDDYAEMSNNEILRYQLDFFARMLDSAITNNYYKVTFIHGIGNGSLKSAIVSALADYENVEFRNAPFARFGNGAVDIIIHKGN